MSPPELARAIQVGAHERGRIVVFEGLFGLLVLIADVWAILNVFQSSESTGSKALWTVLVLVLPVLGFVIWYFAGPKARSG
jgi:succinate dehydrogenase/fumarate reductase cytochrome b subunit